MATKYKLFYLDIKGLGEPIRFMLSHMDVEFEDVRFSWEEWPSIKPSMPFGKVPVLEVDGKKVSQSRSIMRYLGKKAGLRGKDEWEDLQIDMIVDIYGDFLQEVFSFVTEKNEKVKAEKLEKLKKEIEPFYFEKLDQVIKDNNGYLANKKLSWADIWVMGQLYGLPAYYKYEDLSKYPNMKNLFDKVLSIPKIKAWIGKHP